MVEQVKVEMALLNEVDKPGSDIEKYVIDLDQALEKKMNMISSLRN
jgi:hypothetical protein